MSVTRIGATKRYSDNWDNIFGGKGRSSAKTSKPSAKRKPAKKKATKTAKKAPRRK